MDNNNPSNYKLLYCPICKHSWMTKIKDGKKIYQCPKCTYQANIDKFDKKNTKSDSLNGEK